MISVIGKYKLVDYTMFNSLNEKIKWEGSQNGVLEYSKNGKVLVLINRVASKSIDKLTVVDKKKLFINYVAKYKVLSKDKITHKIISCNHEERVGSVLHRSYVIEGDQLIITGEGLAGRVELVWERVHS